MDFHKLKLDKFQSYNGYQLPNDFDPGLVKQEKADVYFLFVESIMDVMKSLNYVQNQELPKENRLFFVFKKGNKGFGRDHIYNVVMKHKGIKRKAPILASLNKSYSVFCFMLEK